MKIWSNSLSYLKSIRDGYVSQIARILSDEYTDDRHDDKSYSNAERDDGDSEECKGECPPPQRSHYNAWTHFSLDQEHLLRLSEHHLQLANTLHIQPCDASHWLICNPIEAGNIAVIDEDALSFLKHFRMPVTVQEIIVSRDLPIASLLAVALIFLDLGFLCDLDQTPVVESEHSGGSTLSAWLHITNACNLRCHYCYVSKSSEHMEQETSRRAVDAVIRSAMRHGYEHVHLKYAGGEAALQMPQVMATHDYAQRQAQENHLRLSATLLSNGTILTQRMIEQLKERHIRVMISLDGIGEAHDGQRPYLDGRAGSFVMVDRTISRLLTNNLRPSINVTVSQRNIADLSTLLSYILERDLPF